MKSFTFQHRTDPCGLVALNLNHAALHGASASAGGTHFFCNAFNDTLRKMRCKIMDYDDRFSSAMSSLAAEDDSPHFPGLQRGFFNGRRLRCRRQIGKLDAGKSGVQSGKRFLRRLSINFLLRFLPHEWNGNYRKIIPITRKLRLHFFSVLVLFHAPMAMAGNPCLIVGDSLSKEYSVEGPVLWNNLLPTDLTDYTKAIKARNWMEILIARRSTDFDFGAYGTRTDSRAPAGHAHDWAVPGSTTAEWQGAMNGASLLDQFVLANFDSDLKNGINRVVIFLGGNDLNNNYAAYYNGADPSAFISTLLANYAFIVQHIKSVNSAAQIVICTVPDVGATPNVQSGHPDPAKRALVTSLTETLNSGIAQLATQQGLGLADVYALTGEYLTSGTITIGGLPLIKGSDKGNYPTYIFSEDGFHPNTCAQALFANEVIRAFDDKFQAGIAPLTDLEIIKYLESQHGVTLPEPVAPVVPALSGTFSHDFSGDVPLWDISGSYSGIVAQGLDLEFSITEEPSGKLTGTGTMNLNDGAGNLIGGAVTVSGAVKTSGTVTRVSLSALVTSGSGTAVVNGTVHNLTFAGTTVTLPGEIEVTGHQLVFTGCSAKIKAKEPVTGIKYNITFQPGAPGYLDLPGDADGGWDVTLVLNPSGNKFGGSADVQTLPGKTRSLNVTGTFFPITNSSNITIKGAGSSLGIVLLTSGSNVIFQTVKGKLYGQTLKFKAP